MWALLANRRGGHERVGVACAVAELGAGPVVHLWQHELVDADLQPVRRPSAADEHRQRICECHVIWVGAGC